MWSGKGKIFENPVETGGSGSGRGENCRKPAGANCGEGDANRRCALLSSPQEFQHPVEKSVENPADQFFPRSRMFLMRVSTSSFRELSFWMDWEMLLTA